MIKIIRSYQVQGSVIAVHADDNAVYFANTLGNFYTVDKERWEMIRHDPVCEPDEPLHTYQKGASFSPAGVLAYSTNDNGACALCRPVYDLPSQNEEENAESPAHLYVKGHDQRAEIMRFCGREGQYLITGGTDGKVYIYSSESGRKVMSLKPRPDYISSLAVDEGGNHLVCAAYDKSMSVLNLRFQKERLHTYLEDVVQDAFFYNDSKSLYAIGREGYSYIYDFKTQEIRKKVLFPSWPTSCVLDESGRYAIVGTRSGHLHIVRLADNTLFSTFKLDQKGIGTLHIHDSTLHIGFENGWLYVIDMHAFIDDFSQAVSVKNYRTAKICLDKNLFLAIHPMSEMFQEAWEETLKEIINRFSTGNAASALEFAEPFLGDGEYKKEFEFLLQKQKDFEKFAVAVQNKNFLEAFGMLEKAPYLAKTDSARKLELYFTKHFAEAKKLLSADPLRNAPKAQELLKPFTSVPGKKEMIHALFKNYSVFLQSDALIKEKKFKEYFILTDQNPFLQHEELYKKVCALAEASIKKIRCLVDENRYDEAIAGIKQVAVFLPYRPELAEIGKAIQLRRTLLAHILADDIQSAYELVSAHPELESMREFAEYDRAFDAVLTDAMAAVGKGEIKLVQQIMAPYASIAFFQAKIKECVRQAAFNRLSNLLTENSMAMARTIAAYYLKEFGKDDEYEKLLRQYGLMR
ncbi:hypothetical protein E0765_08455 [Sulfuricurvum sp. IAE1]|uniref:WD40 repeat domain-containing protein n=1 Tax=Sulfuricurvum sp. IAE1 TaxID=2546102 RepID=UPI00104C30B7|nr:hypothetical protein [Sulfuricurvum sp. IAE1]TDA63225.1 hypothetical protein E0765_08455 [Sulfuricurvum sp. IAE1]